MLGVVFKVKNAVIKRLGYASLFAWSALRTSWFSVKPKVVILGAPFHKNLGDQAQTLCAEQWLKQNYPNYKLTTFDTKSATMFNYLAVNLLKKSSTRDDLIFLHSGYHTTDLYPLENDLQKKVIETFPNNKIVILPQTINYESEEEGAITSHLFNSHKNLTVMCRDNQSYDIAKDIFSKCKLLLFPDIVTSQIGLHAFDNNRLGINLCLRNDKESLYKATGAVDDLMNQLESIDKVTLTDTNGSHSPFYIRRNLKKVITQSWNNFSKYKVTVTDRYHGTIFSLIAGTPVVVLSSTDHKLKSGVKWFPKKLFKNYVFYAESIDEAASCVKNMHVLATTKNMPTYFNDEYYKKLKAYLDEE